MEDAIIVIILSAIVLGIVLYLWRAKKRGKKCVGCPYAEECNDACHCTHKTKSDGKTQNEAE